MDNKQIVEQLKKTVRILTNGYGITSAGPTIKEIEDVISALEEKENNAALVGMDNKQIAHLLNAGICPNACDGGVIPHPVMRSCQYCAERRQAISALEGRGEGEKAYRCIYCKHIYMNEISDCDCKPSPYHKQLFDECVVITTKPAKPPGPPDRPEGNPGLKIA